MKSEVAAFIAGSALVCGGVVGLAAAEGGVSFVAAVAASSVGFMLALRNGGSVSGRMLIATLIIVRIGPLAFAPELSDDWFRYVHEARASRVDLASVYAVAPQDMHPAPDPDDGLSARVNHPEIKAAYPPLSQLSLLVVFALADAAGAPLAGYKLFLLLLDLCCLALCFIRRGRGAALLYGLCPLVLLEVHFNAHVDACAMTLLFVAFFLKRQSHAASKVGALIGLAAGFKPIAPLALSTLGLKRWPKAVVAFAIVFAAPYVLYLSLGAPVFSGFVEYATRWEANATLYKIAEAPFRPTFDRRAEAGVWANLHVSTSGISLDENGVTQWHIGEDIRAARPILVDVRLFARLLAALLFFALGLLVWRRKPPNARPGYLLAGAYLCAPTLHPWYLLWALPSAALTQDRALSLCIALAPTLYASRFGLDVNMGWLVLAAYAVALWRNPDTTRSAGAQ